MPELKVKWEAISLTLCQMCISPAGWRAKAHMTSFPRDGKPVVGADIAQSTGQSVEITWWLGSSEERP